MKRFIVVTVGLLLIAACFAPVAAAQQRVIARVHLPFAFNAHDQTLDAGTYDVLLLAPQTLRFQHWKTEQGVTLLSPQSVVAYDDVKVAFRVYGKHYFMAEVNAPTFRIALPQTREEKEIARSMKPRTVEIAAE